MIIQGKIHKNNTGLWKFEGVELTNGQLVEIMIDDAWVYGRIEYANDLNEYVLLTSSNLSAMVEKRVRLKEGLMAQIYKQEKAGVI